MNKHTPYTLIPPLSFDYEFFIQILQLHQLYTTLAHDAISHISVQSGNTSSVVIDDNLLDKSPVTRKSTRTFKYSAICTCCRLSTAKNCAMYSTSPIVICLIGNLESFSSGLRVPMPLARLY